MAQCRPEVQKAVKANSEARELLEAEALLAEVDDQRKRLAKRKRGHKAQRDAQQKAAEALMAGPVGSSSERLPLQLLTKQKCVAWRWPEEDGVMKHMVGIGCSQPFSPFSDDEVESRKGCKRCA
eukprot:symbB.v1.2.006230.t1/scaffold340.1/size245066/16